MSENTNKSNLKTHKLLKTSIIILSIICFVSIIYVLANRSINIFIQDLNLNRADKSLYIHHVSYDNNNYEKLDESYYQIQKNNEDFLILNNNNFNESIIQKDIEKIKDILNISIDVFHLLRIDLDRNYPYIIYKAKNSKYIYYFYVDNNNECVKFEVCDIKSDSDKKDLFEIQFLDLSTKNLE